MSRMVWIAALSSALGRPPTDEERTKYLASLAEVSGGEYVYVPKLRQSVAVDEARIHDMRRQGASLRKIARSVGCSKSHVRDVLSKFSPYVLDTEAA